MEAVWKTIRVQDLIDKGEAELVTGPFGTQLHASDYTETGTPVINVRNIGFGDIREDKLEYISEETVQRLSRHLLEPEDIVFGRKGAVDRHAFIKENHTRWFQGSDCLRLRLKSPSVFPRFVSYYFLTEFHKTWMMNQCSHGATMASLNQAIVSSIPLPFPSPDTQRRIVDILSTYDDLIANNNRRMALLEESIHLLYREWFARLRFPGHERVKVVEGVPEGWGKLMIGEVLQKLPRKKRIKKGDYLDDGPIPAIDQGSDFIGGYTDDEDAIYDTPLPVVVFGDHTRILKFIDFPFASGADGTQILYPKAELCDVFYLYFGLRLIDLSNYAYARHFKYLKQQHLLVAPSNLRQRFTEQAEPAMKQISTLRNMNDKLRQTRNTLLPRLMDGDIIV
jgi:type I restriction enzyme S subunit